MEASEVMEFVVRLQAAEGLSDAPSGIDLISALETVKCAAAAVQAHVTDAVAAAIREDRKQRGKPKSQWDKGIASQIGLARRESHNKGGKQLGLARALVHEMPHTHARLLAGDLNEWRATVIARETACLTVEDRLTIDKQLCSNPAILKGLGDKSVAGRARAAAAELDPSSVVKRFEKSYKGRRTSTRPQPDFMCTFTTLTSTDRAICMWATLGRDADSIINAGGQTRNRDQIMADLAYERITGAGAAATGAPMTVNVIIPDTALVTRDTKSGYIEGYGDIPSDIARHFIGTALSSEQRVTLRKLYANPTTGALTAMESTARTFPKALATLIDLRDRLCRTPWCDAPIRHHDHIKPHATGGSTSADNGAGLCAACNLAKEGDGWWSGPKPGHTRGTIHIYDIHTPTGHRYTSEAPAAPVLSHYCSFLENDLVIELSAA
ncbi:HNH endonuclease signature motif containing protein [Rhodococcus sp. G-MC3]|uniref:HNH endonuclease n=1 Tax=Rhodococcus sp. G-MC3 TaxID=3046209 RepID=UPI0024B8F65D|nr:HNH endonuclease signature motif containing protein [Rhodococcus sp. G-MC3]MDJ0393894.1 HNH endonuclease signature motif containing protein [Rhodococcus sp. G-MC3]